MNDPALTLRRAGPETIDRVETVVAASGLPTEDIREKPDAFFIASAGDETIGVGGIERAGEYGLLRSVVVSEASRGEGYGRALCDALEARARADGVRALYLLTTTAAAFFRRCGYEACSREAVPEPIRATPQFAALCPRTAACLSKRLDR
jgi:amino-acid N-acetyltransferase